MKKRIIVILPSLMLLFSSFNSCSSTGETTNTITIGASAGALAGAVIDKATGNTPDRLISAAAEGGPLGAVIDNYMDQQALKLDEHLQNAVVERVSEGIKITFDAGKLFDIESSILKDPVKEDLEDLARILKEYKETHILFAGHTDNRGPSEFNQQLSEQQARSVAKYLAFIHVDSQRIRIMGYGESHPIASNDSREGMHQNRRIEIAIWANEDLKQELSNNLIGSNY